ncbi:uncharacterized protein [Hyperolius riggenbachi]|uniref:uncharacterized protein n=1 Tax=Hyperolius riggenbachi TaxID=752182 RepID=UPI0035A264C3
MPSCIVKGCNFSWKKKDPNVILHSFPGDLNAIKAWLLALRRATQQEFDNIDEFCQKILMGKPKGLYRMCSQHFTVDCYYQRGMLLSLKKEALPTIFPDKQTIGLKALRPKVYKPRQKKVPPPDPPIITSGNTSCSNVPTSEVMCLPLRIIKLEKEDPLPQSTPSLISEKGYYVPCVDVYSQKRKWTSQENNSTEKAFPLHKRTKSLGTNTEYFPGQRHKSTVTDICTSVRHKEVQTEITKDNRISCRCNHNEETRWATDSHLGIRTAPPTVIASAKALEMTPELLPTSEKSLVAEHHRSEVGSLLDVDRRSTGGARSHKCSYSTSNHIVKEEDSFLIPISSPEKDLLDVFTLPKNQNITSKGQSGKCNIKLEDTDLESVEIPGASGQQDSNSEKKYIVFDSCLNRLLMYCRCLADDGCNGRIVRFEKYCTGSSVSVRGECSNHHEFHMWDSQP